MIVRTNILFLVVVSFFPFAISQLDANSIEPGSEIGLNSHSAMVLGPHIALEEAGSIRFQLDVETESLNRTLTRFTHELANGFSGQR